MDGDDREARLRHGEELWERLRLALDAHSREPIGPSTDWTGHDVYAHFGRWQDVSLTTAHEILTGRKPAEAEEDENVLNNRWRDDDRGLSTDVVRERCLRSRAELRELLMSLTNEQWSWWGSKVAADISGEHYEHHLADAGVPES